MIPTKTFVKILSFIHQMPDGSKIHIYDLCKKFGLKADLATPLAVRLMNHPSCTVKHLDTPSPYHHEVKKNEN